MFFVGWEYVLAGACLLIGGSAGYFINHKTSRAKIQAELNKRTESLVNLRAFQDEILGAIPDSVFIRDSEFKIVFANDVFIKSFPEEERNLIYNHTGYEKYDVLEQENFLEKDKEALEKGHSESTETVTLHDESQQTRFIKRQCFLDDYENKYILGISRDISTIKEAQSKLAESEERYALMTEGSSIGLWDWDIRNGKIYLSDHSKKIIGLDQGAFNGTVEELSALLIDEDKQTSFKALEAHIKNKEPYDIEYRIMRPDGRLVWIHAKGQAIWDDNGRANRMAGSIDDITQERLDQNDLKSKKELLELAEQTAKIGHWKLSLDPPEIFWSKQVYIIHGVSPENFTPDLETALAFYVEEDRERVQLIVESAIENSCSFEFEAKIKNCQGKVVDVISNGTVELDDNGSLMSLFGTFQDISERKRQEEEIKKYALLAQNTKDSVVITDIEGRITWANEEFDNLTGYIAEEYIGKKPGEFLQGPDTDEEIVFMISESIKNRESISTEILNYTKDKTPYWIEININPIISQGGEVTGFVAAERDITDKKNVERALEEANAELEEFAYRTSHDLRSPLISSLKLLEMLEIQVDKGKFKEAQTGFRLIKSSLEKLEKLVEDILNLTRAKHNLEEEDVFIGELVDTTLEKMMNLDGFNKIKIIKSFSDDCMVHTSKLQLSMIIDNLLSNAIKYSDFEKEEQFISIVCSNESNSFRVDIEDNGLGIPKEYQNKMFAMFNRFHPKVSFGSGLGMYLMKKSAKAIDADIIYEDTGQGSRFSLKFNSAFGENI